MVESNLEILELIKQNKSLKEIAKILNISEKQLFIKIRYLINYGYNLEPSYSYNSDIYYKIKKNNKEKDEVSIKLPKIEKEFRCIALSDIHIGNKDSDIDLLKRVYEYASKNNINIIFNCGDLIEGVHTSDRRTINDVHKQIEFLIDKHPFDKNINNFVILGNHDYHSLHYDGLDISKKISNSRYDIIPIGFGQGNVNIKDDFLTLKHKLSVIENSSENKESKLVLVGHGHMMKTKIYDKFLLCLPSLSYVSPDKTKEVIPGFVDLNIHMDKGRFEFVEAKQMLVTPRIIMGSETRCRMKTLSRGHK